MKPVKPILCAAVLSLALSISAFAGDIQSPAAPTPPPATCTCESSTESVDSMAPGESKTGDFTFYVLLELLSFF